MGQTATAARLAPPEARTPNGGDVTSLLLGWAAVLGRLPHVHPVVTLRAVEHLGFVLQPSASFGIGVEDSHQVVRRHGVRHPIGLPR